MYNRRFTPERIESLQLGEIFVFGSNLDGYHGGGAARIAHKSFGAIWGQGVGLQGQSYAIPTMQGGVETISPYVEEFIAFAKEHRNLTFLVTRIGCGIAGFSDDDIAPLFRATLAEDNIILPESFVRILEPSAKMPKAVRDMLYGQTRTLVDILKEMNKREPITDPEMAIRQLGEFLERNQRYGDETAFMAQRTIWCLLSQYRQEGLPFDLDRLEKDMYEFHEGHNLWVDSVDKVYYKYCVAKIIRYVSFLNTFRRYKDFEQIDHDIQTVDNNHCGENTRDYFFGMDMHMFWMFQRGVKNNADEIFKDGHLDNEALEKVFFMNHQELLDTLGIDRMIEQQYGQVGCHPDIQAPKGKLVGPVYRLNSEGRYDVSCNGTYRPCRGQTWFETTKAKELLESSQDYKVVVDGYYKYYVPVRDYTLPVISELYGIMEFPGERAKRRFIQRLNSDDLGC